MRIFKYLVFSILCLVFVASVQAAPAYPLKMSTNKRYLVDQNNSPFLLVGDSPQALIGNLSLTDSSAFLVDRKNHGFNAVWINLLCDAYTGCNSNGTTFDGIAPFTSGNSPSNYDLSTPNSNYFTKVDAVINQAAANGLTVFLDPIETGGWLTTLQNNGSTKDFNYGVYLGNRYKNFPNIVWMSGNDFATYQNASDDALALAVANGIKSVDTNHIQTAELGSGTPAKTSTLDDPNWAPIVSLNAAYTYEPTYDEVLHAYNQTPLMPTFLVEEHYDGENVGGEMGTPNVLRRQEYWTLLSGATGQLYGSQYWNLKSGWQTGIDTVGVTELQYVTGLFSNRSWYTLVPDQNHTVLTAGFGTFATTGNVSDSDYATAARSADGSLVMAYLPTVRTVTIDMTKLSGNTSARWFDPTLNSYTAIGTYANTGTRQFTPPATAHADGTHDWVLVLETATSPAYPLKMSSNKRYLVDQNNVPFLIKGDSPQGLIGMLSEADASTYFADRKSRGFNTAWVSLLCLPDYYSGCHSDGSLADGSNIKLFNGSFGDLTVSNLNSAYFSRVDNILNIAKNNGIVVFLDPIETGSWLQVLRNNNVPDTNGHTKDYNFGAFLGSRYQNFSNILWFNGNDFQTWRTASDDAAVLEVAKGIKSVDSNHLQTVELDYNDSGSLDDANWASIIGLDASYSYYPQYNRTLTEYNRANFMPVFFVEGDYEFQDYAPAPTAHDLRAQEYWSQLSGTSGQLYGNNKTYPFLAGWQNYLDTVGTREFGYASDLFSTRSWFNLVPDQNHSVVTAGYGTYDASVIYNYTSNYVTTARSVDGSLIISYLPTSATGPVTVDMTKLAGTANARWFDPTLNSYSTIGSFANTGSHQFIPPTGSHSDGTRDWVLVLETGVTGPTPTIAPTPTPATSFTMGETNILSADDNGNGGLLLAQQATLSQRGTLQSLSFYVTTASGRLQLGVYNNANNYPGNLIATTAVFTPTVGWNTQNVQTPVLLNPGTYWLAYLPESNNLGFKLDNVNGLAKYYNSPFGNLPTTFSSTSSSGPYKWSFYATLVNVPGDANGDGVVNVTDLQYELTGWFNPFNSMDFGLTYAHL